jgi:acyl-CoA thioesterase-2
MRDVLHELLALLDLETLDAHLFRGQSLDLGWGQIFGGQVLGQALVAAERTVPKDRSVHSMHGYFLRKGDVRKPIVYTVDPIRDGRSFTTRRVVAIQGGKAIFSMAASFQVPEVGFDHHDPMPEAAPPESLHNERELAERIAHRIPEPLKERALGDRPIDIRPVAPLDPIRPDVRPAHRQVWYRAADALPDDPSIHRALLAWASDSHFLVTATQPHGVSWLTPGIQVASLDHSIWFHRPFRFDDWLLYDIESPSASGSRGLVWGRFYTRSGELVATTTQEGLMRDWRDRE